MGETGEVAKSSKTARINQIIDDLHKVALRAKNRTQSICENLLGPGPATVEKAEDTPIEPGFLNVTIQQAENLLYILTDVEGSLIRIENAISLKQDK